jgi:uncharacterized membrane protein YkvI
LTPWWKIAFTAKSDEIFARRSVMASTRFQRFVLPAFAFKAVVIGGGYATRRELAEYFLPAGPLGGLSGMMLATIFWSVICAVTFQFAHMTGSLDYRSFFTNLLGRAGVAFELAYYLLVLLALSVFGAAAGEIGHALLGVPVIAGTLALCICITTVAAFGNDAVETLFKYVSVLLYGTYALFFVLCLHHFAGNIGAAFAQTGPSGGTWAIGGLTYASYNIIGAAVILPVCRHLTSRRDAVVAGLICGPLAMLPAILFFLCMLAFYPAVGASSLPSDLLLRRLDLPTFRWIFQLMIFAALLESGTGMVHAVNERIAQSWRKCRGSPMPVAARLAIALVMLVAATEFAGRFGLVMLIAHGYRALAWIIVGIYVLPLMTLGLWRLYRTPATPVLTSA